jgi:Phosducin
VTEASSKCFVLVHLTSSLGTNVESRILTELWRELAKKYGDIKFCEIRADLCVEGYPERNTPTILVYRNGEIVKQVITLAELNGLKTSILDLERMLLDLAALKENDARMKSKESEEELRHHNGRQSKVEEEDDEWD